MFLPSFFLSFFLSSSFFLFRSDFHSIFRYKDFMSWFQVMEWVRKMFPSLFFLSPLSLLSLPLSLSLFLYPFNFVTFFLLWMKIGEREERGRERGESSSLPLRQDSAWHSFFLYLSPSFSSSIQQMYRKGKNIGYIFLRLTSLSTLLFLLFFSSFFLRSRFFVAINRIFFSCQTQCIISNLYSRKERRRQRRKKTKEEEKVMKD